MKRSVASYNAPDQVMKLKKSASHGHGHGVLPRTVGTDGRLLDAARRALGV